MQRCFRADGDDQPGDQYHGHFGDAQRFGQCQQRFGDDHAVSTFDERGFERRIHRCGDALDHHGRNKHDGEREHYRSHSGHAVLLSRRRRQQHRHHDERRYLELHDDFRDGYPDADANAKPESNSKPDPFAKPDANAQPNSQPDARSDPGGDP